MVRLAQMREKFCLVPMFDFAVHMVMVFLPIVLLEFREHSFWIGCHHITSGGAFGCLLLAVSKRLTAVLAHGVWRPC